MLIGFAASDSLDVQRQSALAVRQTPVSGDGDRASLKDGADAQGALGRGASFDQVVRDKAGRTAASENGQSSRDPSRRSGGDPSELTPEEEQKVRELKKRDREVRQHEQAHARAAGPYGGQPQYQYERGPDGKQYAVSGEVKIDTSEENSPEATVRKMEIVMRAALAPADPSSQDRQVAAEAKQKKAEAQAEIRAEKQEEQRAALERQQQNLEDPASAGLPRSVTEQAASAYGSALNVIATASRAQNGISV